MHLIHNRKTHISGIKGYLQMFATLREIFVRTSSKRVTWTKAFLHQRLPTSQRTVCHLYLSSGQEKNKVQTIHTSYEKYKGLNAYIHTITQNIFVLMFEVSLMDLTEGKSCKEQQRAGSMHDISIFLFTITMHERTITVVWYTMIHKMHSYIK